MDARIKSGHDDGLWDSPAHTSPIIPAPQATLTLPSPLFTEGPDRDRRFDGKSGRRRGASPGEARHGEPGRVHPEAQASREMLRR